MEEKYLVWHISGGLGKNVASTALISDLKNKYSDRKLIMVVSWPEVFLNHIDIDKVYQLGQTPYFYENYIENKDTIIFKQDPYDTTGHISKTNHIIKSWCEILGLEYKNQQPYIPINYSQLGLINMWKNPKPTLLLQTTGGPSIPSTNNLPSPYDWTRDLPIEISQTIIAHFSSQYHILHITRPGGYFLEGVERLEQKLTNSELVSLIAYSSKHIFIDSSLQHISAALNISSIVFWIGTSPKVFGYKLHNNIVANLPKRANQLINSYTFDYNFTDNHHECPYMSINEMFNMKETLEKLGN